jgi:hypothetical protein
VFLKCSDRSKLLFLSQSGNTKNLGVNDSIKKKLLPGKLFGKSLLEIQWPNGWRIEAENPE